MMKDRGLMSEQGRGNRIIEVDLAHLARLALVVGTRHTSAESEDDFGLRR